jgi:hypothetical protein
VLRDIPKGDAVCLGGGLALDTGLDTNRNNALEPNEITGTEYLECEGTPQVRALHAAAEAPAVNILVNGTEVLSNVDFGQGSGFISGVEEVNVQVQARIPSGDLFVIEKDYSLDYSTDYTIIAVDGVEGVVDSDPLVIANPNDERLTPGYFFAQVVHAADDAPPVDVYVTPFGADLGASAPVTGAGTPLAFGEYTPRLEVLAGDYQIRITPADTPGTVVYDSGEITLGADADLLIAAIDNVGLGDSAVQLVVMDGSAATTLYDVSTGAAALALHLSPDAGAVDIFADIVATAEDEALQLAENVSFGDYCVIDDIPAPVDFTLSVVADAGTLPIPYSSEIDGAVAVIVSGFLSSGTPAITALPLAVDFRSILTEAKIRLTHASPSTPDVDIYLLPEGGDIETSEPAFEDVPFGADTGVLSIPVALDGSGTTYDVYVTAADSKVPAIAAPGIEFFGGEVWDVIARDPAPDSMEMGPQPVIIDYNGDLDACVVAP